MKVKFIILLFLSLTYTFSQENIEVIKLDRTECDKDCDTYKINNRIISQTTSNLLIGVIVNCCFDEFKAELNDNKLNLIAEGEEFCTCDCYFELNYHFNKNFKIPDSITFNKKPIYFSEHKYKLRDVIFELYKNDTINLFDKYGFKQGRHIRFNRKKTLILRDFIYHDDKIVSGKFINEYYQNKQIKSEAIFKNEYEYIKKHYDEKGKLLKECIVNSPFDDCN